MSAHYKLYEGDNLAVMRGLPSESIDLIYIDPPYFSQRNYGDFDDRWKSMQHYLDFMVERLKEMHRLLKPTGSIYVHLDWHAVHYVKVEMDKIFNFQNEIIWSFGLGGSSPKRWSRKHNNILFYTKSDDYTFTPIMTPAKSNRLAGKNKKMDSVWLIPSINNMAKERIDYATQKPLELMERIILASSNEGDLVADFFCGSGSFIKKAFELGRRCIGCDMSPKALALAHCPTQRAVDGATAPQFQRVLPADVREGEAVLPAPPRN